MPIDTNIFKDILFFCLLPITILIGIAILYCFIKQKEKKYLISFTLLAILFLIYFIYSFFLMLNNVIVLKHFNIFKSSKISIILWILFPIVPAILTLFFYSKRKELKEGEKNAKKASSN